MTNKKYKCFDLNVSDNIANLVLSRPNELNTMSRDFWVELGCILEEININFSMITLLEFIAENKLF